MCMTISDYISLISSVAALITAIVVFFTLLEMKKQRQRAYKPDLIFKPTKLNYSAKFENGLNFNISYPGTIEDENKENFDSKLFNIGLGTAKKIIVKFSYDYKKALKTVIEEQQSITEDFGLKIETIDSILKITFNNLGGHVIDVDHDFKYDIDYVLPTKIYSNAITYSLPSSYKLLFGLFYLLKVYKNPDKLYKPNEKDFPPLNVSVEHLDIGGKKYKNKYLVPFMFSQSGVTNNKQGGAIKIHFEFRIEFREI